MQQTTPGQLLIDSALPEDMRGKSRELHGKGMRALFQELADRYPDKYKEVALKLQQISADTMFTSGGYSFGLKHLLPSKAFTQFRDKLNNDIQMILADPKLSEDEKSKKIVEHSAKSRDESGIIEKVYQEALKEGNPLAKQIYSGSKGKPHNLSSIVGGDILYEDHNGRNIPLPVLRSYSEGLTPGEYWAGTYGARKGTIDLAEYRQCWKLL